MNERFVAYYRVSTRRQGLGLDAQRATAHQYAETRGAEIIAEYSEKESGKSENLRNRHELFAALDLCRKTGACLLIAKLDRLARDVEFTFHLKNSNAQVIACDLPDFNTLNVGIFATMAQHEREICSQRTKAALSELKKNGVLLGANNGRSHVFSDDDRQKAWQTHRKNAFENENSRKAWHFLEFRLNVSEFQLKNGRTNFAKLARALTDERYLTPNGGAVWNGTQVKRVVQRFLFSTEAVTKSERRRQGHGHHAG